jgi:hypothetical protein
VVKSGLGEKKILLLYARDCEVVLNAVQAFKTMLQCTGNCQVSCCMLRFPLEIPSNTGIN